MFVPAPEIFKAYDIRGIVDKTLTVEAVRAIGHALGSEAVARKQQAIAEQMHACQDGSPLQPASRNPTNNRADAPHDWRAIRCARIPSITASMD